MAQLGHGRAAAGFHGEQRGRGLGRVGGEHLPGRAGLHDHHADVVRHHVVQFAGEVCPLLGERPLGGGRVLGPDPADPVPRLHRVADDRDQHQRERGHEPGQPPLCPRLNRDPRARGEGPGTPRRRRHGARRQVRRNRVPVAEAHQQARGEHAEQRRTPEPAVGNGRVPGEHDRQEGHGRRVSRGHHRTEQDDKERAQRVPAAHGERRRGEQDRREGALPDRHERRQVLGEQPAGGRVEEVRRGMTGDGEAGPHHEQRRRQRRRGDDDVGDDGTPRQRYPRLGRPRERHGLAQPGPHRRQRALPHQASIAPAGVPGRPPRYVARSAMRMTGCPPGRLRYRDCIRRRTPAPPRPRLRCGSWMLSCESTT